MNRAQTLLQQAARRYWRAMRFDHVDHPPEPFEVAAFMFGYLTLLVTAVALLVYLARALLR